MTGATSGPRQCAPYPPLLPATRTRPTDSRIGKPGSWGEGQILRPHVDHGVRTCLVTGCQAPPVSLRFGKHCSRTRELGGRGRAPWQGFGQLLPPACLLTIWYAAGPPPKVRHCSARSLWPSTAFPSSPPRTTCDLGLFSAVGNSPFQFTRPLSRELERLEWSLPGTLP